MLRGVVVIDAASDIIDIRTMLEQLIIHAYESVKSRTRRLKRTVFTPPKSDSSRIALVVDKQPGPRRREENGITAPWGPAYTPFKGQKKTKRDFLLYLAGYSPTSAGQSAAWNAKYYHGLQMLYELKRTQGNADAIWIDLADQFNEPRLAEARLRLRPRGYAEEELAKVQPNHIREFFESISVKGYLDDILSFLYNDGTFPLFDLKKRNNKRKVIIVTGADTLRDATPSSHRERFSILIDHLLSILPNDDRTTIVWFDSPVPSVEKSIFYSSRALLPYYDTSPLGAILNEIIWNLPIAPWGSVQPEKWGLPIIGDSPMHDDIRVIIRHSPSTFHMELTHVPFLRGWSKRFRNKGTGRVIREREIDDIVPDRTSRNRMNLLSLTILPWLVKLWPQERLVESSTATLEEQVVQLDVEYRGEVEPLPITKTVLSESPCNPPSLLDLVKFRLPEAMSTLSFQEMTVGKINSQRLYRSPHKLQNKPLQRVPAPPPTQELPAIEDELEQEWLFGVKFESEGDDPLPWWMVVQDPAHPSRMLVGCFIDRPPDKDGYLWAENKHDMLIQSSLDEILGFHQTFLIGKKDGDGMETWSSIDSEAPVYSGVLELRGQGRSIRGRLRAIRQTFAEEPRDRPSFSTRPSESFYKRMVDSLQRQLAAVTSPTPVSVRLMMIDDTCCVTLQEDEGEVIQEINIEYTADLLSLLRRPVIKGGPMFTDSGVYVTWSIFDDINYGDLDFIRSYVTYTAARKTPEELPKRVSQFFDEAATLAVSIEHDSSVCPIALGEGVDHGACWRIDLPSNCPVRVRKQLSRALTGEEVNGLLAPGRLYAGKLYIFDLSLTEVSEKDESIVFHEERYIRMFLRNHDLPLKKLPPGTFLQMAEQQWVVSIELDVPYFKWHAQSTASGFLFRGNDQIIDLVHGHGAQEEGERLLNVITSQIPSARIFEYTELEERVLSGLKNRGYSKSSPACELRFIEQSESICRYGVFLVDGAQREPFLTFSIEATEPMCADAILDGIVMGLAEGNMSAYNIRNTEVFLEKMSTWVSENVQGIEEEAEEPEEWTVNLSIDTNEAAIIWEAEKDGQEPSRRGVLYDDPKILLRGGIRAAVREVRETFEIDIVSELGVVSNLNEVMKGQIPDVVRSLRLAKKGR